MNTILKIVFESSLFASIMILVILSIKRVLVPKVNLKIISFLWLLVLIRLLLPLTVESPVHIDQIFAFDKPKEMIDMQPFTLEERTSILSQDTSTNHINTQPPLTTDTNENTLMLNTIDVKSDTEIEPASYLMAKQLITFAQKTNIWTYVFTIWLIGATGLLLKTLISYLSFNKRIKKCKCIKNESIITQLDTIRTSLNIQKKVKIFACEYVNFPVTFRLFKPIILLPIGFENKISKSKFRLIILHECCHIKRKDILVNYLWFIAKTIHWFNPLVWIAYKQYLEDVELSCDEMVLKHISEDESFEYSQSLLDVIKLSQNSVQVPIALSFCEDKTKIRKRVENMLNPKRKRKSAGMIALLLALIMVIGCFTTACEPTVNDKISDVVSASNEIKEPIEQIMGHLNMEFEPNSQVKINVNADVISPNYKQIPLIRVKPENFSKEQFNDVIDYTIGDNPVYYQDDDSYYSKEEIEAIILNLKSYKKNDNLPLYEKNSIDDILAYFEENYETAISKSDEKIYNGQIKDAQGYSTNNFCKSYLGKDQAAHISLSQSYNKKTFRQLIFTNTDIGMNYNIVEDYCGIDAEKLDISYKQAKEMAEELIKIIDGEDSNMIIEHSKIGYSIGGFANYTKETSPQTYIFYLARQYEDVIVKNVDYLRTENRTVNYDNQIYPEYGIISIDNTGFYTIAWLNYTKHLKTTKDNIEILDFSIIQKSFEKHCESDFSWIPSVSNTPEDLCATIDVKTIEMNFIPMLDEDDPDAYVIIPVWDFIADVTYDEEVVAQNGYPIEGQKDISILTINAMDRTIINREQGY